MKKNGWFFGDSFTWGQGCHPNDEYYKYTINNIGKRWTELVSENLNIIENNLGRKGASNPFIINQIITNIKYIKNGDYVFIGNTLPIRTIVPHMKEKRIISLTSEIYVRNTKWYDSEHRTTLLDYIHRFILPFEDVWDEYYINQYLNLKSIIRDKGANVLFWKHNKWHDYETIQQETNNQIDDGHWTWDSHIKMSEWILGNLKSDII
jgi:uncharacterized protein (UPF0297 family)